MGGGKVVGGQTGASRLAGSEPDGPETAVFTGTSSVLPDYLLVKLFQTYNAFKQNRSGTF